MFCCITIKKANKNIFVGSKVFFFFKQKSIQGCIKSVFLNSSPRDPLLCILCMSPLFNTPDSDPQLYRIESMNWTECVRQNVQSSGYRGLKLRTTALNWSKVTGLLHCYKIILFKINAVLLNFLLNPEKMDHSFHIIMRQLNCFSIDIIKKYFLGKYHVTLKTGVMMLKIPLCRHRQKLPNIQNLWGRLKSWNIFKIKNMNTFVRTCTEESKSGHSETGCHNNYVANSSKVRTI